MKPAACLTALAVGGFWLCQSLSALAADWPMWRHDAARSAETSETLPDELHLRWVREYPKLRPAYREARLQFDAGYEPVVLGKTMFVASSVSDCVTALDTKTGEQRWEFFAAGPIRCAPAAWRDRVFFGSDDGCIYCLDAESGELRWRFRAVPSHRRVLGNGRMISLWPVRGGPVVHQDKVYFAAGVWSFEGTFVYCLDAATGKVVWRNDESSFVYGQHPHDAKAMGGVTPQGYLVVAGKELIVPCGQAVPARFDLRTGKLTSFALPKPGRRPGGWFASADIRRGEVKLDAEVNRDLHEDKVYQGPGSRGVRTTIVVGGKAIRFDDGFPGVEGKIHTMLAADGKLFVVNDDGRIYCFGDKPVRVLRHRVLKPTSLKTDGEDIRGRVETILNTTKARHGYALIRRRRDDSDEVAFRQNATHILQLADELRRNSNFHLVVTDPSKKRLDKMRRYYRNDRQQVCLVAESSEEFSLPPYFASLLVFSTADVPNRKDLEVLRPDGGVACMHVTEDKHEEIKQLVNSFKNSEFSVERVGGLSVIRRLRLPGATNYTGGWASADQLVRAPLGVLWFNDGLGHFKRSPQPWFVDGVMVSYPKDWMEKHRANRKPPYDLLPPVFSDVYTGRVVAPDEALVADLRIPQRDADEKQPSQYRPPKQEDAWKPKQPIVGIRVNPLTGEKEPRSIPKSYGCDGGVDYGNMYTMRSGTPAFYDKQLESGVCSIGGPRSGCTNSIIPACGVLNVPFFYEGCTCSYPLPVGLAMVSLPPRHEQWSSWGTGRTTGIQRVGINFGAPGDRMTRSGTLWLDYPNRGGPSPDVAVSVEPETATYFYQHSLFVKGGSGWPWVAASGVEGARSIKIKGLKPASYTVRLSFFEPVSTKPGIRVFDVTVNRTHVSKQLDVASRAGGPMRSHVLTFEDVKCAGEMLIELTSHQGSTLLSGIEILADDLE